MKTAQSESECYRILVVDDNQAIHEDLRKILLGETTPGHDDLLEDEEFLFDSHPIELAPFEIDSAYQGQQGLEMVDQAMAEGRPYALAFVDVRMPPGWDGVETVFRLWQSHPELQVVICTAYSDYSWNDMVRKLGHSDNLVILKKPFDNIEVIQLAHALTKKWRMSREAREKHDDLERLVREATEELTHRANHDTLTGLPNRRLFTDRLEQAIRMAHRRVEQVGLLYLDLDGFKNVNDTLGHSVGDKLLLAVVDRLKDRLRGSDTLARMGGDEFTLVAAGIHDPAAAEQLAQRLHEVLQDAFSIDGNTLFVTASVGISIYPRDGRDVNDLLRCADAAMYQAKRLGKNRVVMFEPKIGEAANQRLELEVALRMALTRDELSLHFQPQYELGTRRLVRFEALLRWNSPTLGVVPPLKFVPIAEEAGLIVPIGNWVLEQACRTARKWSESGFPDLPVAVNVSAHQFRRDDFIDTVMSILEQNALGPNLLELELTETVVVNDFADVAPKIAKLRTLGVGVSIDDFGSGYSSFSYLEKLPVAAIKVDRSFVQGLEDSSRARSVVRGMVRLAHSIGLRVVVEGVETMGQLEALSGSDADEVQGYLFGYPAPAEKYVPNLTPEEASKEDPPLPKDVPVVVP